MKKNAEQILDADVRDWEASSRRQSFIVPPGTYKADLKGMTFDAVTTNNGDGVVGGLTFLSVSPVEGLILKVNRFLTSKNDKDENYGIGQLFDELDLVHAILGWKPVDRTSFPNDRPGNGKKIRSMLEKILEEKSSLKGVTIIVGSPEKSKKSGRTYQTINVGLGVNSDGEEVEGSSYSVGGEVEYQGKTWKIEDVNEDDEVLTLKSGRKTVEVGFDDVG